MRNSVLLRNVFLYCIFALPLGLSAQSPTPTTLIEQAQEFDIKQRQKRLDLLMPALDAGTFDNDIPAKLKALSIVIHAHTKLGNITHFEAYNAQLRKLAIEHDERFFEAKSYFFEGEMYDAQSKHADALEVQRKALAIYEELNNKDEIANSYVEIAGALSSLGRYGDSLNAAEKAKSISESIEDLEGIASAYNSISIAHEFMGNYQRALEAILQTIAIDQQIGNENEIATSLFNVAAIYENMEDYAMAKRYYQEALAIDLQTKNPDHIAYDYMHLGNIERIQGEFEIARSHILRAHELFQEMNATRNLAWAKSSMGKIELEDGQLAAAREYLEEALALSEEVKDDFLIVENHITLAKLSRLEKEFAQGHLLLDKVVDNAVERKSMDQMEELFTLRSEIFEDQGQYLESLTAYKKYHELHNQVQQEMRSVTIANLQNSIDYLRKEHTIELLEKDQLLKEAQLQKTMVERNAWVAVLLAVVVILAAIGYRERTRRKVSTYQKQMMEELVEKKNQMLAEVSHELRSPLTALQLQIEALEYNLEDDPKAAYNRLNKKVSELNQLIEDLYQLARADNGLLKLDIDEVSVTELVQEITDGYSELVQHHGLTLETEISANDNDVIMGDELRLKQVIVNLIRNSLNYTDAPGTIKCTTEINEHEVKVLLEDTAPGVSEAEITRLFERMYRVDSAKVRDSGGSGLGLSICKSLIDAHGGSISASPSKLGGLKIVITLPNSEKEEAA